MIDEFNTTYCFIISLLGIYIELVAITVDLYIESQDKKPNTYDTTTATWRYSFLFSWPKIG